MDWNFSHKPNLKVETFTPRAIKVLGVAGHEAANRGHALVNDLHLLLGLFYVETGAACAVLKKFQLDPGKLRAKLASDLKPGHHGKGIPFDPICREITDRASAEATRLHHHFVGTEHLLLGILKTDGSATQWLQANGVKPGEMIDYILQEIPPGFAPESTGLAAQPPGLIDRVWNFFNRPLSSLPAEILELLERSEKLTPRARQTLALACQEAKEKHHRLDDLHLLFGLCELGQGVAVNVVTRLGGDWKIIRENVSAALAKIPDEGGAAKLPEGTYFKAVFLLADRERRALNHPYLGTEHIFLGILQAGGPAATALSHANLDIETVRRTILQELDPNFTEGPAALFDHASTDEPVPSLGNEFTPRVQQALSFAQTQSREQGIPTVGALQVLAGLLSLGSGVAVNVLQQHGVTLDRVQTAIKQICPPGEPVNASENIPYTLAAYELLSAAHLEAILKHHTLTGAEHLLLAILKSDANSLFDFFKAAGVDREVMIELVLKELNDKA